VLGAFVVEFDRLQRQFDSNRKRARAMIEAKKNMTGKKKERKKVRADAKTDHNRGATGATLFNSRMPFVRGLGCYWRRKFMPVR
jgi:hypothetical protein